MSPTTSMQHSTLISGAPNPLRGWVQSTYKFKVVRLLWFLVLVPVLESQVPVLVLVRATKYLLSRGFFCWYCYLCFYRASAFTAYCFTNSVRSSNAGVVSETRYCIYRHIVMKLFSLPRRAIALVFHATYSYEFLTGRGTPMISKYRKKTRTSQV